MSLMFYEQIISETVFLITGLQLMFSIGHSVLSSTTTTIITKAASHGFLLFLTVFCREIDILYSNFKHITSCFKYDCNC